jgi:hypothetical protein
MVKALQRGKNDYNNHVIVPVPHQCFVGLAAEPMLHDLIPLAAADTLIDPCQQRKVSVPDRSNEKQSLTASEAEPFAPLIFP